VYWSKSRKPARRKHRDLAAAVGVRRSDGEIVDAVAVEIRDESLRERGIDAGQHSHRHDAAR
jgi:hypothetical protein